MPFSESVAEIYKLSDRKNYSRIVDRAAEFVKSGGLIIYPTDTLYGFGANIYNPVAMERLYTVKGKDANVPVSIMVNSLEMIEELAGKLKSDERDKLQRLFPGKITVLIPIRKKTDIARFKNLNKLGFRIPDHSFCNDLNKKSGYPISTTSVNISGEPNLTDVTEILDRFGGKVDCIIDGGPVSSSMGSSIIDLSVSPPKLIRPGEVSLDEIEKRLETQISTDLRGKFVVTFVCSGNICRSPMAERVLKKTLEKTKFKTQVIVQSASTLNLPASPAHLNAVKAAREADIDLEDHLSQRVSSKIMRESHIIFCMALNHYQYLRGKYPGLKNKIVLLKQWQVNRDLINPSIADPIGHDYPFFKQTFREIQSEITRVLPYLIQQIKAYLKTKKNGN